MSKIKVNDDVIVIAGRDKGKRGKVLSVDNSKNCLIVDGVNIVKKHVKSNPNMNEQGGILEKNAPIHRSNVMIYDQQSKKGSRVGYSSHDGQKVRIYKTSKQVIESN